MAVRIESAGLVRYTVTVNLNDDTRVWLATPFQKLALRIANGPIVRLPDGLVAVDREELAELIHARLEEADSPDDDAPNPESMQMRKDSLAMIFNEEVEPAVTHAGSMLIKLQEAGFSEEAAEQLAGNILMMATSQIMGGIDPDEYE